MEPEDTAETVQINLRLSQKIIDAIDEVLPHYAFLMSRQDFIRLAIDKLLSNAKGAGLLEAIQ